MRKMTDETVEAAMALEARSPKILRLEGGQLPLMAWGQLLFNAHWLWPIKL